MGRNVEILAFILFCTAVQLLTSIWLSGGPIPCLYGGETPALDRLTLLGVDDGLYVVCTAFKNVFGEGTVSAKCPFCCSLKSKDKMLCSHTVKNLFTLKALPKCLKNLGLTLLNQER